MQTRTLGSLEVTVVGVGCSSFGTDIGEDRTRDIVDAAVDHGVTFFDTADRYGDPVTTSETILGRCLKRHRDKVLIATKFGRYLDDERQGAKPAYVRAATEASLRRLQTDHIDLMQLHIPDPDTPIEETLAVLSDLIDEGKIREIGGSNFTGLQLEEMRQAAEKAGLRAFASTQTAYSLLDRTAELDVIPECRRQGMKVLPYWPLFNGLLTGKYRPGQPLPAGSRIAGKDKRRQAEILSDSNLAAVAALQCYAEERGRTLLELAYGWLLAHDEIPSIIAGVSSPAQVASNVGSAGWLLTAEQLADIDAIAPVRAPATTVAS